MDFFLDPWLVFGWLPLEDDLLYNLLYESFFDISNIRWDMTFQRWGWRQGALKTVPSDLNIPVNISRILDLIAALKRQDQDLQLVVWNFFDNSNIRWDMSSQRWDWWQGAWWMQRSDLDISVNICRILPQISAFEPSKWAWQLSKVKFLNISNIGGDMGSERLGSGTSRASVGLKPRPLFLFCVEYWSATYRSICYCYQ